MASNNQDKSSGRNRARGRTNNPAGRNQYSGLRGTARQSPFATAAAVGGAVAAGVFLWSRRNQISDQIENLSDQLSDWREGVTTDGASGSGNAYAGTSAAPGGNRSQAEIAQEALSLKETGRTG